jgi:putative ABC transport system ATP-binding protein
MLLADEPTGNLDTRTSLEVLALLQRLNRDRGITIVLVTHEHDIAACASRVVMFRDGRVVSDVRQDTPFEAAAELEKLPATDASAASEADDALDPAAAARRRLGGPVPALVYLAMVVAAFVGALFGWAYNAYVLDYSTPVTPLAFAFAFECLGGAWFAGRRLGRALTSDQRARIAVTYTCAVAVLVAPFVALGWVPGSKALLDRLEGLRSSGLVAAAAVALLGLATVALARYLVLALVSPLVVAVRAKRASGDAA